MTGCHGAKRMQPQNMWPDAKKQLFGMNYGLIITNGKSSARTAGNISVCAAGDYHNVLKQVKTACQPIFSKNW